jgi:hypothetical protein
MPDFYGTAFSQNFMFARSKKLITPADGTYNVIRIPRFGFVKNVWVKVITAFSAGNSFLTVGWSGNKEVASPAGFMTTDVTVPTSEGLKMMLDMSLASAPGKWFDAASGAVTITTDDAGGTAGTIFVFVDYAVIF